MSFKDQMRKDFETVILNTDEFAETFLVIRNGAASHEIDGIFSSKNMLQVKLDTNILPGDILQEKSTSRQISVQNTSPSNSCLSVYCR